MNILISLLLSLCYSFSHRNNIYILNSFQFLHSVCACVGVHVEATGQLEELVLSFHDVGQRD